MKKNFRAIVVRNNHDNIQNFIKITRLDRDLMHRGTWERNNIVQVHVISSRAFVANSADELKKLMVGLEGFVSPVPKEIEARQARKWILPEPTLKEAGIDATEKLEAAKKAQDTADSLAEEAKKAANRNVKAKESDARTAQMLADNAKDEAKAVNS